jgi:regulator of RNase E activity RraA
MLDDLRPNMVCVWNANGHDNASHWGGVMTRASRKRGVRGAIIDGGIRDTKDILEQGFPIWYRYRTSNGALSRCKITGYQVPVVIEGVIIKPGDLMLADIDGGLVVPRKLVEKVLERAETIEKNEGEIRNPNIEIRDNVRMTQIQMSQTACLSVSRLSANKRELVLTI